MPNTANITAPITIVGNGRSGTSLISQIFHAHPNCHYVGETVNLIHSVSHAMTCSLPESRWPDVPDAIRGHFLQFFPSPASRWMHKPIGVPVTINFYRDREDEFLDWFWQVLEDVFPDACYLTVLRHPLDILHSSHEWWGRSYAAIANSNRLVAKLITHPRSKVDYAVHFEEFVASPESSVRSLLDHAELPFHGDCLQPFERQHASKRDHGPNAAARGSSHQQNWQKIDQSVLTDDYRSSVEACWSKFGLEFGGWTA